MNLLILRCGDPVGRLLLDSFPAFMWASSRFHRFVLREQFGDESDSAFRADATVHIEAPTHDAAQAQMEDWVAEHMPSNFVIGWTLTQEDDCP